MADLPDDDGGSTLVVRHLVILLRKGLIPGHTQFPCTEVLLYYFAQGWLVKRVRVQDVGHVASGHDRRICKGTRSKGDATEASQGPVTTSIA